MGEWNKTRALIEAGWHSGCALGAERLCHLAECPRVTECTNATTDWDDVKQAQHDGSRQIYGGMFTPQREN